MVFTIPKEEIQAQLLMQLKSHFFITEEEKSIIEKRFDYAIAACEENFSHSANKYYYTEVGGAKMCRFNPYHSVQYMTYLYYLSHDIFKNADAGQICDKIYYLNKIFHSVDLFYAIDLPAHFGAEHPLGAVMGRADYSNGFFFYQGCTVGGTYDKAGNIHYAFWELRNFIDYLDELRRSRIECPLSFFVDWKNDSCDCLAILGKDLEIFFREAYFFEHENHDDDAQTGAL